MSTNQQTTLAMGTLLPRTTLCHAHDGTPAVLRSGRGPLVLLLMHSGSCAGCLEYMRALLTPSSEWARWGARVFGIVPGGDGAARAAWAEGAIARALLIDDTRRLADGTARVIAADEWGEIHASEVVGARHDEPTPLEMIDWARFIAIQCPECEGPEGEWRNV